MPKAPYKRGTILLISGPCNHLFIICNDPIYDAGLRKNSVLAVNISSIKEDLPHDTTCIISPGDHPYVAHRSYVVYSKAEILCSTKLEQSIVLGEIETREDVDDQLFNRVLSGFGTSRSVPYKIKRFYERYCK
mgnify:CR=1 FL=1